MGILSLYIQVLPEPLTIKTTALTLSLYSSGAIEGQLHKMVKIMNKPPKGKTKFTKSELDKIRKLIIEKCQSPSAKQKDIRDEMRALKFYITDFTDDRITSVDKFDRLVSEGIIRCDGEYSPMSVKKEKTVKDAKRVVPSKQSGVSEKMKGGLDAIVGENPRILILGSFPGEESLQKQEYYAKAGNRFWKIMYSLFSTEESAKYSDRTQLLTSHGIAIWDVLKMAEREGSLDSSIQEGIANDIANFLNDYPTIKVIAFNGKKAAELFSEYDEAILNMKGVIFMTLLSSSGRNRKYSFEEIKKDWSRIIK